nr:MAG TPA: hypothetical protein [Caudoviricetes sp.]
MGHFYFYYLSIKAISAKHLSYSTLSMTISHLSKESAKKAVSFFETAMKSI